MKKPSQKVIVQKENKLFKTNNMTSKKQEIKFERYN